MTLFLLEHTVYFKLRAKACGIIGFVRFLKGYYMNIIESKEQVARIGKFNLYSITSTKLISLFNWKTKTQKHNEEKYVKIFKEFDMRGQCYFSYSYDLTHTLQENILLHIKFTSQKKENYFLSKSPRHSKHSKYKIPRKSTVTKHKESGIYSDTEEHPLKSINSINDFSNYHSLTKSSKPEHPKQNQKQRHHSKSENPNSSFLSTNSWENEDEQQQEPEEEEEEEEEEEAKAESEESKWRLRPNTVSHYSLLKHYEKERDKEKQNQRNSFRDRERDRERDMGNAHVRKHSDADACSASNRTTLPLNQIQIYHYYPWKEMYVWNFYQNKEFNQIIKQKKFILPIIHGFIAQTSILLFFKRFCRYSLCLWRFLCYSYCQEE